jgi:DNA-directed RNA polymerase subunit H (RpoH/RPB5)
VISSVNIVEHELVPKHEVLSKEEKQKVLDKFKITTEELPKILSSDAVMEYLKAKPGDVVRIMRDSPTAGETVYYRVVV